jgi:hypothetical protein
MFTMRLKSWWNGDAVRERLLAEHKAGVRALAEFVAERVRFHAPVDTGRLRASIHVVSEADGMRHHVTTTVPYAEPQEFGFRMRNGRFYPPRAYFRLGVREGAAAMPRFIGGTRVRQGYARGALMGATFE